MFKRTKNEKKKRKMYDEAVIVNDDDGDDSDNMYETMLYLKIHHAEGIDQSRPRNSETERYYRVYAWVNPDINDELEEVRSRFVQADPDPNWNLSFPLSLGVFDPDDDDDIGKYLHLEVVKIEDGSEDPKPSHNEIVVGRTRIRVPNKFYPTKSGSFELVKLQHEDGLGTGPRPAGRIMVSMALKYRPW